MKLLTSNQRKELIERVALKYHPDGMDRLKETGSIKQYLPLYHYTICEPNGENHIFVTDFSGNNDFHLKPSGNYVGQRLQYHGGYGGLNAVICTWIGNSMIAPENMLHNEKTDFGKDLKLSKKQRPTGLDSINEWRTHIAGHHLVMNPSFTPIGYGKNLDRKLRENFDKSLIHLYEMIGIAPISDPLSLRDIGGEQISSTYNVI